MYIHTHETINDFPRHRYMYVSTSENFSYVIYNARVVVGTVVRWCSREDGKKGLLSFPTEAATGTRHQRSLLFRWNPILAIAEFI